MRQRWTTTVWGGLLTCAALSMTPVDADAQAPAPNLTRASLDELMRIEVTSVSKKEEKLSEAPSAIFVLTAEDLARAGVTTVAEALRLVPGLHVARIDANKWAISARGFNGRFADKMLVLMDGRSVYTPLFSGVYWDIQDTAIEDIDRVEVIRGPGATLWGANAVNGIINIITKSAEHTQGALVSLRSGADEPAVLSARYGGAIGDRTHYRAFTKFVSRGPLATADGGDAADATSLSRAGVRIDQRRSPDTALLLDAQAYGGFARTTVGPGSLVPITDTIRTSSADLGGGHVLGRGTHAPAPRSEISLQAYVDYTWRGDPGVDEKRRTADVEFQHHTAALPRQDIVWGTGVRVSSDRLRSSPGVQFATPSRTDHLLNMFVQNEVTIVPGRLRATGGLKLEHNSYTGWEWQPDARLLVLIDARQTLWASISRAVRTPSRAESDVTISSAPMPGPDGIPIVTTVHGQPHFRSATLRAHEVGYRIQPTKAWSFDVAAFVNRYDRLRTFEPTTPAFTLTPGGPMVVVPVLFDNQMAGTAHGAEVVGRWEALAAWRVDAMYSFLDVELRPYSTSLDTLGALVEDSSPRHQLQVRSTVALAHGLEIDGSVARVGAIRRQELPGYTRVDARLAWHSRVGVTLEAGGRNLLDDTHLEFTSTLGELPTWSRRSLYAGLRWMF